MLVYANCNMLCKSWLFMLSVVSHYPRHCKYCAQHPFKSDTSSLIWLHLLRNSVLLG